MNCGTTFIQNESIVWKKGSPPPSQKRTDQAFILKTFFTYPADEEAAQTPSGWETVPFTESDLEVKHMQYLKCPLEAAP